MPAVTVLPLGNSSAAGVGSIKSYSAIVASSPPGHTASAPSSGSSSAVSIAASTTKAAVNMNAPSSTDGKGGATPVNVPEQNREQKTPAAATTTTTTTTSNTSTTTPPSKGSGGTNDDKAGKVGERGGGEGGSAVKEGDPAASTVSPPQPTTSYAQVAASMATPQRQQQQQHHQQQQQQLQQGYYVAHNTDSQVIPESPSPHGTGGRVVYDMGSFFQQPGGSAAAAAAAGATAAYSPFSGPQAAAGGGVGMAPNSPGSHSIPPASPLFPRMTGPVNSLLDRMDNTNTTTTTNPRIALSPGPPYAGGVYMTGAGFVVNGSIGSGDNHNTPSEDFGWGTDSRGIPSPYPPSPQMISQGMPIPYVPGMPSRSNVSDRSGSFDETMLPPSAVNSQVQHQTYGSPEAAGTLFAHQQSWAGYGSPVPDMYGHPSSPLQPRPTIPYPGQLGGPPPRHSRYPIHHPHPQYMQGPIYGGSQYFPATSPGPPIQTAGSNKGPDGANLFIFHIPNHFTNVDMYQLFCQYGNLLSVRIMVEKDTGRSRGFGFVSYDNPDAAALAIKQLNGFVIGNKRLKVQHKQIRPSDPYNERHHGGYGDDGVYDYQQASNDPRNDLYGYGGRGRGDMHSLPPSGPSAGWYNRGPMGGGGGAPPAPSHTGDPGSTSGPPAPGGPGYDGSPGEDYPGGGHGNAPSSSSSDPLGTMDPLRQTLPDVGGAATSAVTGNN